VEGFSRRPADLLSGAFLRAGPTVLVLVLALGSHPSPLAGQERAPPEAAHLDRALLHLAGESDPIHQLRALYHRAVHDERMILEAEGAADRFLQRDPGDRVVVGYLAALEALRARHGRWPPSRLRHLKNAREGLDSVIVAAPSDPELRYLRLATELHVPRVLGREEIREEDRRVLEELLASGRHTLSPGTERLIMEFIGSL
jgi:hypothetical protein